MRRTSPTSFFWVPFLSLIQTAITLPADSLRSLQDLDIWFTSLRGPPEADKTCPYVLGRYELKILKVRLLLGGRHVLGGTYPYGSNPIMNPSGGQVSWGSGGREIQMRGVLQEDMASGGLIILLSYHSGRSEKSGAGVAFCLRGFYTEKTILYIMASPKSIQRKSQMASMQKIRRKSLLYQSKVEFADFCINHVEGCSHGCRYPCYAMMMKKRCGVISSYEDWCRPKIVENAEELLERELRKYKSKIRSVHLCFSTDPFMFGYDEIGQLSLKLINRLNSDNIPCTILTKGVYPKEIAADKELTPVVSFCKRNNISYYIKDGTLTSAP